MSDGGPLPLSAAEVQAHSDSLPFNKVLGIRVHGVDATGVRLELPWQAMFTGSTVKQHMHGGIVASLIDCTCGLTVVALRGTGAPTVDMRVDFHRGASPGPLFSTGKALRIGRTLAVVDAEVLNAEGKLVASGRAVFSLGHGDIVPR